MKEIVSITKLCIKNPPRGKIRGVCVVCGDKTNEGLTFPFSEKFTGYSFLTPGNCTCPYCHAFFSNQDFRRKSWVATKSEVLFPKRTEIINYLTTPPPPPFAIYITRSGQRQGWLSGMKCVNLSRDRFHVMTDFVGTIFIERGLAETMDNIIKKIREKNIPKKQLYRNGFSMATYKKAIEGGYDKLLDEVQRYIQNPLWEVMVYVAQ